MVDSPTVQLSLQLLGTEESLAEKAIRECGQREQAAGVVGVI
jgi:hypothetical protein